MEGSYAQISGRTISTGAEFAENVLARCTTACDTLRLTGAVTSARDVAGAICMLHAHRITPYENAAPCRPITARGYFTTPERQ